MLPRAPTQSSMMNGQQHTRRHGGNGMGLGDGNGPCSLTGTAATTAPSGALSAAQKTKLARMAEEEELAHDVPAWSPSVRSSFVRPRRTPGLRQIHR